MFGKRLKAARLAQHLTQQKLADLSGVALRSYQKYEQGERCPSYELLVLYADILDVPIDWLLGRDDYLTSHGVFVDVPL